MDILSYTAAKEARMPIGSLVSCFSIDHSVIPPGWVHLDGSLISRAQYPLADKILGDVRFFNKTPTVVSTPVVSSPSGSSVSQPKYVSVGAVHVFAFQMSKGSASSLNSLRVYRSDDDGTTWTGIDLGFQGVVFVSGDRVTPSILKWFGGNRLVMVFSTGNNYYASLSNDLGLTWGAPKAIGQVYTITNVLNVIADAEVITSGQGYYYYLLENASNRYICGQDCTTGTVGISLHALSKDSSYGLIAARSVGSGSSELHFVTGSTATANKVVFNGNTFSGLTSSPLLPSGNNVETTSMLVGGRWYCLYAQSSVVVVYDITYAASAKTIIFNSGTAVPTEVARRRFLSNTLLTTGGDWFDLATATNVSISGYYAGDTNTNDSTQTVAVPKQPSKDVGCFHHTSNTGALILRGIRRANGFFEKFTNTADATRVLSGASALSTQYGGAVFDHTTGEIKKVEFVSNAITVSTYTQADDYANYLQLPYKPDLMCCLR